MGHSVINYHSNRTISITPGRVSTTDLVKTLSVDHTLIDKQAEVLVASQDDLYYVLGQLVSKEYLDGVAEEINEKLQQAGITTISNIVKHYDLPGDFMQEVRDGAQESRM